MIRVLTGDELPPSYLHHLVDTIGVSIAGDTLAYSSTIDLGAASFVFNGDVDFELLDTNFQVKSEYLSGKTRILFYSLNGARFEHGTISILRSSALQQLDSCQFSGYYGNLVVTKNPE